MKAPNSALEKIILFKSLQLSIWEEDWLKFNMYLIVIAKCQRRMKETLDVCRLHIH